MTAAALEQPAIAEPKPRLLTAADLAALPCEVPSGTVMYELDDGRLVVMAPPGDFHAAISLKLGSRLLTQGEERGLGKARNGDVGVLLRRNPDRVVGVDAVFITNESLPLRRSPEGFLETIPELMAEVRSKNDTLAELRRKAGEYLQAGAKVVWIVDPVRRAVIELRVGLPEREFGADETLTAEDIIPGFRVPVRDLFAE